MASSDYPNFDQMDNVQRLRKDLVDHGSAGWDKAWVEKNTPWDAGRPQPSLVEILKSPQVQLPTTGRALVPGCGRGYDPVHIATVLGLEVIAMDISETALKAANEYKASLNLGPETKVNFQKTDFFTFTVFAEERFNLIYDYTFFCAIPPELREPWGKKMAELAAPGGFLITAVYPIDGPREGGPPYSVSVEIVAGVLGTSWQKIVDKVPEGSLPKNLGRERVVVWQRINDNA